VTALLACVTETTVEYTTPAERDLDAGDIGFFFPVSRGFLRAFEKRVFAGDPRTKFGRTRDAAVWSVSCSTSGIGPIPSPYDCGFPFVRRCVERESPLATDSANWRETGKRSIRDGACRSDETQLAAQFTKWKTVQRQTALKKMISSHAMNLVFAVYVGAGWT